MSRSDDSDSDSNFDYKKMRMCGTKDESITQVVTGGQSLGAEKAGKGAYKGRGLKWKVGQTIHVKFLDGPSSYQNQVAKIAETWEEYANIKFKYVTKGYSDIRIGFDPKKGWFSEIGTLSLNKSKNEATMNLVMGHEAGPAFIRPRVLHEFGHALGLVHEHQSPAARIRWNKKRLIRDYTKMYGFTKEEVLDGIIGKANSKNYSKFDPKSIMIYEVDKTWTKDGRGIPESTKLSNMDKEFIGKMYPFPESDSDSDSDSD